jgi:hypothetical protein
VPVAGDPKPLADSPCPLGPELWGPESSWFTALGVDDTALSLSPLLPPVSMAVVNVFPFTLDVVLTSIEDPHPYDPVETMEMQYATDGGYEVIRGLGCKPAGDYPFGGMIAAFQHLGSGGVEGGAVAFTMPSPGDRNGLRWIEEGSPEFEEMEVPDTAESYDIMWAFAVVEADQVTPVPGTFELRLNGSPIDTIASSGIGQYTTQHALVPGDVLTVWRTSGDGGYLNFVRIRVMG